MSRAISRDSFDPLKNYLGVHLQQGRVLLDADWNEAQDIALEAMRRVVRDAIGDGSPNGAFAIHPILPLPSSTGAASDGCPPMCLAVRGYPLFYFMNHPGKEAETFEAFEPGSPAGFSLTTPDGTPASGHLRVVEGAHAYSGRHSLRLSGHSGTVRMLRPLDGTEDFIPLSNWDILTYRFRVNTPRPGTLRFVLRDAEGRETRWRNTNTAIAADVWLPGFAAPLDVTSFRILTTHLPAAIVGSPYSAFLVALDGLSSSSELTWEITGLPAGISHGGPSADTRFRELFNSSGGFPETPGTSIVTVSVTSADGRPVSRTFDFVVLPSDFRGDVPARATEPHLTRGVEASEKGPADLSQIVEWGFEVYQDPSAPLVWEFDDIRLGSTALQQTIAASDHFAIRSSRLPSLVSQRIIEHVLAKEEPDFVAALHEFDPLLQSGDTSLTAAGRMYVAGLPCVLFRDQLYPNLRDPRDLDLTAPPENTEREDTAYLDVWTDTVTYVEDPELREIALGGPDTTTREVVRHVVRVAEGKPMPPLGNGLGTGRLTTEGKYTGRTNRLYRVEIDEPGGVGTAGFRWSDDNAATIQRVIESVPRGSQFVLVEDGSVLRPRDAIVIKTLFESEAHQIVAVAGNLVTLQGVTSTDIDIDDRPRIERWNQLSVRIPSDPADPSFSPPIPLNDGIQVRFGGGIFARGDYWVFEARCLAGGEQTAGAEGVLRILEFARPHGVVHHFAPLATLVRKGNTLVAIHDPRPER